MKTRSNEPNRTVPHPVFDSYSVTITTVTLATNSWPTVLPLGARARNSRAPARSSVLYPSVTGLPYVSVDSVLWIFQLFWVKSCFLLVHFAVSDSTRNDRVFWGGFVGVRRLWMIFLKLCLCVCGFL